MARRKEQKKNTLGEAANTVASAVIIVPVLIVEGIFGLFN
jgi:hypothetical protein